MVLTATCVQLSQSIVYPSVPEPHYSYLHQKMYNQNTYFVLNTYLLIIVTFQTLIFIIRWFGRSGSELVILYVEQKTGELGSYESSFPVM